MTDQESLREWARENAIKMADEIGSKWLTYSQAVDLIGDFGLKAYAKGVKDGRKQRD